MYLSKLKLNLLAPEVLNALNVCQDMHINIMQGFEVDGQTEIRKNAGILYRLFETANQKMVYVQSKVEPNWDRARNSGIKEYDVKEITGLLDSFKNDSIMKFNILCSPYSYEEDKKKFIKTPTGRLEWLSRKGKEHGFDVLYATEKETKSITGVKRDKSSGFGCAELEGVLRITDVGKFIEVYQNGLGPRKAYGLGMFLLSKA